GQAIAGLTVERPKNSLVALRNGPRRRLRAEDRSLDQRTIAAGDAPNTTALRGSFRSLDSAHVHIGVRRTAIGALLTRCDFRIGQAISGGPDIGPQHAFRTVSSQGRTCAEEKAARKQAHAGNERDSTHFTNPHFSGRPRMVPLPFLYCRSPLSQMYR